MAIDSEHAVQIATMAVGVSNVEAHRGFPADSTECSVLQRFDEAQTWLKMAS